MRYNLPVVIYLTFFVIPGSISANTALESNFSKKNSTIRNFFENVLLLPEFTLYGVPKLLSGSNNLKMAMVLLKMSVVRSGGKFKWSQKTN